MRQFGLTCVLVLTMASFGFGQGVGAGGAGAVGGGTDSGGTDFGGTNSGIDGIGSNTGGGTGGGGGNIGQGDGGFGGGIGAGGADEFGTSLGTGQGFAGQNQNVMQGGFVGGNQALMNGPGGQFGTPFGGGQFGNAGAFGGGRFGGAGGLRGGGQQTRRQAPRQIRTRLVLAPEFAAEFRSLAPPNLQANLQQRYQRIVDNQRNLASRSRLFQNANVSVTTSGRTVTLRGEVASARERALVARIAGLEPGVTRIENQLTVAE